tara:strand:- start:1385 stop:2260 length:876 start_codon:yes stop_codon:yes gene_type:complete
MQLKNINLQTWEGMKEKLLLAQELHRELTEIKDTTTNILERANRSITLCRNLLRKFKKDIFIDGFQSEEEEIDFFKHIKQIPLRELIYFSEIRSFEIQFPKANKEAQCKFIKRKINKLNRFFLYNMDFGQYVDSGAAHFDKEYYTRDFLESYQITTSKFYFQDPDFFTPRDMLLGKFKAYHEFIVYLDARLFKLEHSQNGKTIVDPKNKLHWPFSNTDYVELLYALCLRGLGKQDKQSIMKVSQSLQQIIDFKPKDIYKTFQDIKGRKNSRTLFLDELAKTLLIEIDKSEE